LYLINKKAEFLFLNEMNLKLTIWKEIKKKKKINKFKFFDHYNTPYSSMVSSS
jgi:hypothetical protein